MRMLLLAGGVAIAALAAVVLVGLRLLEEDEPAWSERASVACESGLTEARAAVRAGDSIATVEQRALQVYAAATEIEAGVLADLEALPRPADDELAIERTLAILAKSQRADLAAIKSLRRDFDPDVLERRVNDTIPILADLRTRFASLGADGCVRYYNPDSYG